mmetsp:Transcript_41676/g.129702  ORF Transcript_41676/g.129702 Transcript_41676/m.129702 type:complete len:227 (-) Transcript_41676:289-969(-)
MQADSHPNSRPDPQVGSSVWVHGLQHKAALNGARGTCVAWDEDLSAWEVQLQDGCTATVRPGNLELVTDCNVAAGEQCDPVSLEAGWAVDMFGEELKTQRGQEKTRDVLAGKRAVLIYFCDKWCTPLSALADSYINYEQSDVEVVFVYSDNHAAPGDLDDFCSDMPWALFIGDDAAQDRIMRRFDITFVPFVPVLRGADGSVSCRNGKNDIESRADFGTLLARWQL